MQGTPSTVQPETQGARRPRKAEPDAPTKADLQRATKWLRDDRGLPVFCTPEQVAEAIGFSLRTVYRWCADGRIPCARPGQARSRGSRPRIRVNRDLALAPFMVKQGLIPPVNGGAA